MHPTRAADPNMYLCEDCETVPCRKCGKRDVSDRILNVCSVCEVEALEEEGERGGPSDGRDAETQDNES